MEPEKIKDLKVWWKWIRNNRLKAIVYFFILILIVWIISPFITGFFQEKGEQLAKTAPSSNSSINPNSYPSDMSAISPHLAPAKEVDEENMKRIKNKLKKLYGEISVLSDYPIPSGDLKSLQEYESRVNKWVSETSMWIEMNIGFGAREKFLNRGEGGRIWSPNYDNRFNNLLSDLKRYKLGLEELIKSDEIWFETKTQKE